MEREISKKESFIRQILKREWEFFQNVHHTEGRANCQDNPQEFDFYMHTKQFTSSEKKKIDSLYEKLKEKVFYSKIENDVFSNYVSHAQALVKGVVDIISEERNGKCYTAAGKRVNTEITSLVLNEVL